MEPSQNIDIMKKVEDSNYIDLTFTKIDLPVIELLGYDLSITKQVVMMWVASLLLMIIFIPAARNRSKIPSRFRLFVESLLIFIRDEIAVTQMGKKGIIFTPYLATLFLFILFCNLLGLVPFGASPTSAISMTASLAIIAFLMIHISGVRFQGPIPYFKSIVPEVPKLLYPLMLLIEVFGHLARPLTLTIRLFANMLAGKIVVLAIFSFVFLFQSYVIGGVVVVSSVFLYCLKIFVAFVQAYVFTFLTAVFIGGALEAHH